MPYKDPQEQKDAQRRHYEANKVAYRASAKEVKRKKRAWIAEQKEKPCADCGVSYPYFVMQFDHVIGEKLFNIGGGSWRDYSYEAISEEIAKCEIVCANCHAFRSWQHQAPLV